MKLPIVWAALATLVMAGALVGCGEKAAEPATAPPAATPSKGAMNDTSGGMENASIVDYTNDKGEVICPVKGDVIPDKTKTVDHQDYKGKRYYFCCAGCPEEFKADPAKFAKT